MAKVSLRASGGLNKDLDPNNLPEGDYTSASNIVFDFGKSGGAGAIRLLESIRTSGVSITNIKATTQDVDGSIYVLGDNGTTASIYKIPTTLDSKTTIVTYTHLVTTTFVPDLKVIGNTLVWNYAEEGVVLSFPLTEGSGATRTISDLKLQKDTPNNVVSIVKNIGTGVDFLESNDFQFASRYQYKNKEYSVLSNYSQVYKGEKGVSNYTLSYDFTNRPYFAQYIEVYVRVGNDGVWRRIDTQLYSSYSMAFVWVGQTYESLDIVTTGNPYDSIPVNAKHIEIAKNRIFLANIKDDYDISTANLDFNLTWASGYTLPSGGAYNSYISGSPLTSPSSSETAANGANCVKPFANNSVYGVGFAYYDSALKTRGVEKFEKFSTGNFAYPMIPTFTVTLNAGYERPSWAKFAQLVYTKNISKSYFYEGYASNIYFQLNQTDTNLVTKETTTVLVASQSVTADQIKDIKYFVVDLMGMYRAGFIYTAEQGDRISVNSPNGVLDLKIVGQEANLIYCEYTGDVMTNIAIPDPKLLYFEIYSPKQVQEDESLVFYEYGNMVNISTWVAGESKTFSGTGILNDATTSKLIGDTVFSKLEIPTYKTAPFLYNTQRVKPAELGAGITADVVTVINAGISSFATSTVGSGTAADKTATASIANIPSGTNGDGASIVDTTSFKLSGFYDIGNQKSGINQISISYNLTATKTFMLESGAMYGSATWSLQAQLYKTPYDNIKNEYKSVSEKIGNAFFVFYQNDISQSGTEDSSAANHIINLSTDLKNPIEANDKFYIEYTLKLTSSTGVMVAQISIDKNSTYGAVITFNGTRTTPKVITSINSNAEVDTVSTKYLIRSISNTTANKYWNTSAGKPSLVSTINASTRRTNTIRYGGNFVAGTDINNISSFFALDSNDVAIENGEITSLQRASRLQGNGSMLLVLCQKESAYIMLGEQELSQGNNSSIYALTANMIGTIRNFGNNLGMLTKQSVMNYKGMIWWWDDFNKKIVKYTPDGLEIPSDTYMRSHFLTKSGAANFSYDPFYNMCFVSIGSDATAAGYSDNLKRWIAEEYNLKSDFAESYGDRIILFKSGVMYKPVGNTVTNDYNHLLGTSYNGSISLILNSRLPINPLNVSISHDMNVVDWSTSNYVKSSLLTIAISNENGQATDIVESNFLMEDNRLYAHILRDKNTQRGGTTMTNAIVEGDYIVGYLNKFVVTLVDKTQNIRINSIDVEVAPVSGHS